MKYIDLCLVKFVKFLNYLSIVGLFSIMLFVAFNVVMRFVFNLPIKGTYEIAQYGMLATVVLALASNELANGNIEITFILEKMKMKSANLLKIITSLVSIVLMGVVSYFLFKMVITKLNNHAATAVMQIPHWILVAILAVGFFILMLTLILKLIRLILAHKDTLNKKLTDEERVALLERQALEEA